MDNNERANCPMCGRPLIYFNGRVGRCDFHKWVPVGQDPLYMEEARIRNALEAAKATGNGERAICPRCGRPLKDFSGQVGRCPFHKWVSVDPDPQYEEEARIRNEMEEEELRSRYEPQSTAAPRGGKKKRFPFIPVLALLAAAAAVLYFFFFKSTP